MGREAGGSPPLPGLHSLKRRIRVIIRNTKPRLTGVAKATTAADGSVNIESYEFMPGNNVVDVERGKWLASIPIFKTMLENGVLLVVSKGGTTAAELKAGLAGIYSVQALDQLRKDVQYADMSDAITARIKELTAPAPKDKE